MSFVFSDTTYINHGLIQECEDITGLGAGKISGNTAKMQTFARRLSLAKNRFFTLAFNKDSLWHIDDRGYADSDQKLPIAFTTLQSGVKNYLFDSSMLAFSDGVFVMDSSGVYHELDIVDEKNDPEEFSGVATGLPTKYRMVGNSIIFDKTPDYTKANGIQIPFKRNGKQFAYTDGGISIGIPELFFEYLANYASKPFITLNGIKNINQVQADILRDEASILNFLANRAKPKRSGLRVAQESNR